MKTHTKYSLALDYHNNTKFFDGVQPFDARNQYKIYPNTKVIPLKKNHHHYLALDNDTFVQTLLSRKSTRRFAEKGMDISTLSKLLSLSFGLRNDKADVGFRTYASAGGRYPIEVYIVLFETMDIEQGVYHYNIHDNSLELMRSGDYYEKIQELYSNQSGIITTDYPCLILFSMVYDRTMEKYGERGYRFILLDAGHMSQNLYLVATYLGLGAVGLGAGTRSDEMFDDFLGLLSSEENVFYGVAIGYPQE